MVSLISHVLSSEASRNEDEKIRYACSRSIGRAKKITWVNQDIIPCDVLLRCEEHALVAGHSILPH
jgi:hypothetical protein